jgi:hypothetical protein
MVRSDLILSNPVRMVRSDPVLREPVRMVRSDLVLGEPSWSLDGKILTLLVSYLHCIAACGYGCGCGWIGVGWYMTPLDFCDAGSNGDCDVDSNV